MSDLTDLLKITWEDLNAPDVPSWERVVLFSIPVVGIVAIVGLLIYAG